MTLVEDKAHLRRRRAYLDEVADEALAAEDETAARAAEQERAEAEAEARRAALTAEKQRLSAARSQSLATAEVAADALVEALASVLEFAALERHVRSELGERQFSVNHLPLEKRLSNYLADSLRRLVGPNAPRWGQLGLPTHFPLEAKTWVETERRQTGEKLEKEDEQDEAG